MKGYRMQGEIVTTTASESNNRDGSTTDYRSIPLSTQQEILPLNKNKPWRIVIRRIVTNGRSDNENV